MVMSDKEMFQKLKVLALAEAECYGKLAEQEELIESGVEVMPLLGVLPFVKIANIQAKKIELASMLNEKARDSAKSTDPNVNIHKFIITPDRR